jgi:mRNA-degrading endonuclease RelE of RelBE toxin-antitoxin system
MRHFASPSFWEKYDELPDSIQELANKNYEILKSDPKYPSLHLKKAGKYWSVRVGRNYRALGVDIEEGILWFWIGTHAVYDKLLE